MTQEETMSGTTQACVSILNVFGFLSLFVGLVSLVITLLSRVSEHEALQSILLALIPGAGAILSGAILAGLAEGLRILSEIRQSLVRG
jgi:choline-glycine betaine transporter